MGGPSFGFMDPGNRRDTDFGIDLTPQQSDRWGQLRAEGAGMSLYDRFDMYRQSPMYEMTDREGRAKELQRITSEHERYADKMLRLEDPKLFADYLNLQVNRKLAGLPADLASPAEGVTPTSTEAAAP